MEILALLFKTILLRPYVFFFLAWFLFCAIQLIGWPRTWRFWLISWVIAFVCEFSSTRTGIPFGRYEYNGSTVGQELYIFNIPFMASLSFSFLLYAAYCTALCFLLPRDRSLEPSRGYLAPLQFDLTARTGRHALVLTALLFAGIDMVIDPAALRGEQWFLGKIYAYPDPGPHFGVPITNYIGWVVLGLFSLSIFLPLDHRLAPVPAMDGTSTTQWLLLGVGLYYSVLVFNLAVTFWIGETVLGMTGLLMFLLLTVPLLLRLTGRLGFFSKRSPCSST